MCCLGFERPFELVVVVVLAGVAWGRIALCLSLASVVPSGQRHDASALDADGTQKKVG
jgi:hypothetical protein